MLTFTTFLAMPFRPRSLVLRFLSSPPFHQFNFTPIECTVTGAGRPGLVREDTLNETALTLDEDNTLRDSLGPTASSHAKAQARKLRGQNARDRQHRQERERRREREQERRRQQQQQLPHDASVTDPPHDGGDGRSGGSDRVADGGGLNGGNGSVDRRESKGAGRWGEGVGSPMERAAAGGDVGWAEIAYVYDGAEKGENEGGSAAAGKGADLVRYVGGIAEG